MQDEKVRRVLQDEIALAPYDSNWPVQYEEEKRHLRACLPPELLGRIEHFGSTAVPGMTAKPIVDMLVEVASLDETRRRIAPILESQGYDYFWRPTAGNDTPPFYAWFIKRDAEGTRTHHIHMVERDFAHWDCLLFRDYLVARPDVARDYAELKMRLAAEHPGDRVAYTEGKTAFVTEATTAAKAWFDT